MAFSWQRKRGNTAEAIALSYLKKQGLKLVEQNFQCRLGEIDLLMRDADSLVVVEVRYRKEASHGGAVASVSQGKQQKILSAARYWMAQNPADAEKNWRFDVLALSGELAKAKVDWIQDAFCAD